MINIPPEVIRRTEHHGIAKISLSWQMTTGRRWVYLNILSVCPFADLQTTQAVILSDNIITHFTAVPEVHDESQRQNFPVTYGE
jgi:hypothetical protein